MENLQQIAGDLFSIVRLRKGKKIREPNPINSIGNYIGPNIPLQFVARA